MIKLFLIQCLLLTGAVLAIPTRTSDSSINSAKDNSSNKQQTSDKPFPYTDLPLAAQYTIQSKLSFKDLINLGKTHPAQLKMASDANFYSFITIGSNGNRI